MSATDRNITELIRNTQILPTDAQETLYRNVPFHLHKYIKPIFNKLANKHNVSVSKIDFDRIIGFKDVEIQKTGNKYNFTVTMYPPEGNAAAILFTGTITKSEKVLKGTLGGINSQKRRTLEFNLHSGDIAFGVSITTTNGSIMYTKPKKAEHQIYFKCMIRIVKDLFIDFDDNPLKDDLTDMKITKIKKESIIKQLNTEFTDP
jgi:hypothetical protein